MPRTDLNDIAAGAADTARPAAESRGLKVVLHTAREPAEMLGDPAWLMPMAMNLVTQSMQLAPAGGVVTLATTVGEATVEFSVSITGPGIARESMPQLLDDFEMHGVEVSASGGGPGQEAVVVVRFARASASTSPADEAGGDVAISGLRVLLVDDHADAPEAHARLLSEHGAVVTTAPSALAALALLAEQRFDVLLSDLGLPGLDGCGLIRRVRHELGLDANTLPALAVLPLARAEDHAAALDAGFQRCLHQPVSPVQFLRTVAELARLINRQALRAFFIEDNDDLREQIAWMLEEEGLQVRAFERAEEALARYAPGEVDLVITDVSLAGMSGIELARAILRRAPEAWVVFSSGYPMGDDLGDFGPHVRALLKPFDFADIRRLVDEIRAA